MSLIPRRRGFLGLLSALAVPGYIAYAASTLHHNSETMPAAYNDSIRIAVNWSMGLTALAVTAALADRPPS